MHALGEEIRLEFGDLGTPGANGVVEVVEESQRVWMAIGQEFEDLWQMLTEAFPEVEPGGSDGELEREFAVAAGRRRVARRSAWVDSARIDSASVAPHLGDAERAGVAEDLDLDSRVIAGRQVSESRSRVGGLKDLAWDLESGELRLDSPEGPLELVGVGAPLSIPSDPEALEIEESGEPGEGSRKFVRQVHGKTQVAARGADRGTSAGTGAYPAPSRRQPPFLEGAELIEMDSGEEAVAGPGSPTQGHEGTPRLPSKNREKAQTSESEGLPDVEEILDALTERVERDYRRFYCP